MYQNKHDIVVSHLNKVVLRPNADENTHENKCESTRYCMCSSVVAISASRMFTWIVNFLKIADQFKNEKESGIVENWGQVIKRGQNFLEAHCLFKSTETISVS